MYWEENANIILVNQELEKKFGYMYLLLTLYLGDKVSLAWNSIGPASNLCLKSARTTEANQHVPLFVIWFIFQMHKCKTLS